MRQGGVKSERAEYGDLSLKNFLGHMATAPYDLWGCSDDRERRPNDNCRHT